ncbi:uncharacterized protein LOC133187156 [Saccostrea echinata]|uniref:uncharacterized protein LOC133187156 n=1 Tax=Saccostrea echinata TaxID=191078 RepID=UPI002A82E6E7|nr:uncharacterized protein LOC133187156 [Saccostrea echinata]
MDSLDQDEVDTLNQAAQTARQRRAENFRRRKVVSEVYDAVLKSDASTQTMKEKEDPSQSRLHRTSQGLLCFTLFVTLVTNVTNIRKYGHQDDSYYTGLMLNCLCVCLQVISLFAALCQCLKEFMIYEVPILMTTLNRTVLKLSAIIVLIQIFLWI